MIILKYRNKILKLNGKLWAYDEAPFIPVPYGDGIDIQWKNADTSDKFIYRLFKNGENVLTSLYGLGYWLYHDGERIDIPNPNPMPVPHTSDPTLTKDENNGYYDISDITKYPDGIYKLDVRFYSKDGSYYPNASGVTSHAPAIVRGDIIDDKLVITGEWSETNDKLTWVVTRPGCIYSEDLASRIQDFTIDITGAATKGDTSTTLEYSTSDLAEGDYTAIIHAKSKKGGTSAASNTITFTKSGTVTITIVISETKNEIIEFVPSEDILLTDFSLIVRDSGSSSCCYIFDESGILLFYSGQNICSKQSIADTPALQTKFNLNTGYLLTFDVGSVKSNIKLKAGQKYYFGGNIQEWSQPYIGNYQNKTGNNKTFDLNPGNIGQQTQHDLWDSNYLGESEFILPNNLTLKTGDYFKYTGSAFGYYWQHNWQSGDSGQIVLSQNILDNFKYSYTTNPENPENGYYMDCKTTWHTRVDGSNGTIGLFKYEDGTWSEDTSKVLEAIVPIAAVNKATFTNNKGYLAINGVDR